MFGLLQKTNDWPKVRFSLSTPLCCPEILVVIIHTSHFVTLGILQHPLLAKEGHSQIDRSLACSVDAEIAVFLLGEYIRPLFRTTQSNNVSSSTGRAKNPTANLVDQSARRGAPLDDEVIWKGGDLRTARNVRVLGSAIVTGLVETHDVSDSNKRDLSEAIAERHAGLGCAGVLYVCLSSIRDAVRRSVTSRAASDATNDDLWAEHWPLLLPPLLQLLEDPAPRYRLMGTAILGKTVLGAADPHAGSNCIDDDAQAHLRMRMSSLLLRTGVASLLARTLDANVTQISHGLAAALFQATSEAWLQLTSLTSADMARHDGRHGQYRAILANVKDDGGKARYERLSELIDAGILRTWAYAPSSARVEDILDPDGAESEADTGGGSVETEDDARGLDYGWEVCKESYEADNLLDVTFEALARLAGPGFLGVGIVRYLDACLEFLLQHLTAGLESKVSRWRQRETEQHKQRGAAQTASVGGMTAPLPSLSRECCAANAVLALVNAARLCPGLKAWTAQCLIAAAKCWTLLDDVDSEADAATTDDGHSDGPAQLRQLLTSIVAVLALAQPGLFAAVVKRLEAIERGRFRALFGAGSSALHLEKETDGTAV